MRVGVADAGVVAVTQRLGEVGGKRISLRHAGGVVQLAVGVTGELGHAGRELVDGGHRDWVGVVKIPILTCPTKVAGTLRVPSVRP